jgi:hypothetical protein
MSERLRRKDWLRRTVNAAIDRCGNPRNKRFKHYGGRGIQVYAPWVADRAAFEDYIRHLPGCGEQGRSLDRINNDGHYEPGNLRWATNDEQRANRRRTPWHVQPTRRASTAAAVPPGTRFGSRVVVELIFAPPTLPKNQRQPRARVRCDCGVENIVRVSNLRAGDGMRCRACHTAYMRSCRRSAS